MVTALEGLTVVDFSRGFPGHLAAMILQDNGAEVVHVEPPGGDPDRAKPAFRMWRRGQKSVIIDLHCAQGRADAARLAGQADVVIQNWRPGVAEQLGLDYERLSAGNPGLIHASITGFGTKGKYAGVKAYDGIVGARAGRYTTRTTRFGTKGREGPPFFLASPHPSYGAAQMALQGILAALYVRGHTGLGQKVETSLVQGLTAFEASADWMLEFLATEYPDAYQFVAPVTSTGVPLSPYFFMLLVSPTKDGKWFQFANVAPHMWKAFVRALGLEHLNEDPDFAHSPHFTTEEASLRYWNILIQRLREKTYDEWMEIFLPDPNIAVDMIRTTQDAKDHVQMQVNGYVLDVVDPEIGPMQQIGPQFTLPATPARIVPGAPRPGEHNDLLQRVGRTVEAARNSAPLPRSALEGVTVLELATFYAAPFGVTLLAEYGARVIKVEPPEGDPMRFGWHIPELFGIKAIQGKESVALDVSRPEGRAIVYQLAEKADLVMCSFRAGVPERQLVDYEALRKHNPNIVYHRGVAYGLEGPFAPRPVYGPTPPAIAGELLYQVGAANQPPPPDQLDLETIHDLANKYRAVNPGLGDPIAALGVCTGMLLGLIARERHGIGQQTMTTMIGSVAYQMSGDFLWYEGKPERELPDSDIWGLGPLYRIYPCADGHVFLAAPQPKEWEPLCKAMQAAAGIDLAADSRFATPGGRQANAEALAEMLGRGFACGTVDEWEERMLAADVACVRVHEHPFARFGVRDPLMAENGFCVPDEHFAFGPYIRHNVPVGFSRTPGLLKPQDQIGQSTVPVLRELGYTDEAIRQLVADGVAAVPVETAGFEDVAKPRPKNRRSAFDN